MPFCPNCGKEVGEGVKFCPECGQKLDRDEGPSRDSNERELRRLAAIHEEIRERRKSMNVTTLLAVLLGGIILCGFGHIYVGRIRRGLAILFADLTLGIPSILLFIKGELSLCFIVSAGSLALWIWQIVDARRICREHNRRISIEYQ